VESPIKGENRANFTLNDRVVAANLGQTNEDEDKPIASSSRQTLEDQPVASSSRQTLDDQPVASSSRQTLEDQPVTSTPSQDSVNNNLTDSDIYGAIRALINSGILPSNFNSFGSASTDDNVNTDPSSVSETGPSSTSAEEKAEIAPTDTSSVSEDSESTDKKGKKRHLPSDQDKSDSPSKRKKTE